MKGILFTLLNRMVEDQFGLGMWESILDKAKPKSKGIYTSGATYEDQELFSLIKYLSGAVEISSNKLIFSFGEYMMKQLVKKYPNFLENKNFKQFLLSIDQTIHVEVRKIYPDAGLPSFTYEDSAPNQLVMIYKSPRKLCSLAEGLIEGASQAYGTRYLMKHTKCLHRGDDHCRLEMTFLE